MKFPTKKTIKFYVGCIEELVPGEGLEVRFVRNCGIFQFKYPEVWEASLIDYDQAERKPSASVPMKKKGFLKFGAVFFRAILLISTLIIVIMLCVVSRNFIYVN